MMDYTNFFPLEENRWPTVEKLYRSDCVQVPEAPGVYFVCAPQKNEVIFQDRFWKRPKDLNRSVPYPPVRLEKKFAAQNCPCLLYIGKASGKKGLRQRLRQYILCGYGKAGNHLGGRAIWQIVNCQTLLVAWAVCPDPEGEEHALLEEFRHCQGDYPLANWRS